MTDHNRAPEQRARAAIDTKLEQAGWRVQSMGTIDFGAGTGIAVREYPTDAGPADYVLFIEGQAVGVIEAKREEWGHKITPVEEQSDAYATATPKWVNNSEPLPFVYESTGVVTRFTNRCDPVPRSREVFSFLRPETMQEWVGQLIRSANGCTGCRTWTQRDCAIARSAPSRTWRRRSRMTARAR